MGEKPNGILFTMQRLSVDRHRGQRAYLRRSAPALTYRLADKSITKDVRQLYNPKEIHTYMEKITDVQDWEKEFDDKWRSIADSPNGFFSAEDFKDFIRERFISKHDLRKIWNNLRDIPEYADELAGSHNEALKELDILIKDPHEN